MKLSRIITNTEAIYNCCNKHIHITSKSVSNLMISIRRYLYIRPRSLDIMARVEFIRELISGIIRWSPYRHFDHQTDNLIVPGRFSVESLALSIP